MQSAFDEAAYTRLAELLDEKSETHNTMRCDEVQAFMLALVSGPDALESVGWLPEILGDALFSDEERAEVETLVLSLADSMKCSLAEKTLPEMWLYEDGDGTADVYTWCNAYLYALDTVPTDWFASVGQDEFEDLFFPIMALGGIYDEEDGIVSLSEKDLARLEADLPHVLLDIAVYWHTLLNKPQTVRRDGEKTGRNDPCPCGSGKKYKACCGRH
ncbi:yecA family protein [Bergeriella denitrificans]|uniref:YecA family protein n=2 Tax=Bergeriella denitrificans TaxID=494 RepID=A0A378UF74_BERDE|nr:YecA family protein [Bergeriella denitrificans]STZ75977.1 yecA family protein [Bergeriella denitrificans]